ncbi:MAG: NADH-quinone oxidoreductase subunit L [Actinomycetota bacterium]|nr:NADH-quinone oxidoreductase subunit L [Actinomycetota bacterium]
MDWQGWAACAAAVAGFALCLIGWLTGGGAVSLPWAPTLDLRLSFSLDGLGALYALLATGVGALVFAYGTRYLSLHLEHERRPAAERWRFWPWMALFAGAMVGLATAQDLILLFVFFDLTAVCSYFLIGFDRTEREARTAALMALLVTVVSAVAMLVAAVLLYMAYGTFSIPELVARAGAGTTTTVAGALLAVAALAKSAQVPLHFWLPRAMVAPTPVSAYLHSAAMVAAGVLVLGRVHPLLARSEAVLGGLLVVGLASITVGGLLALRQDRLKQLLAYSTISQYGYVVMLYGIGGAAGTGAAAFYVLAHGVAKSALFMTAGAVTIATGEDRLSRLGGLVRRAPVLAVTAGVATANLAALPLTVGFFKDELFFTAALGAGPLVAGLAVAAAALTFAYIGRFWMLLFLGPTRAEPDPVPGLLVAPIAVLAVVAVLGGLVVRPFERLAEDAGSISTTSPVNLSPAYHLDARPENLMALAAWMLGGLLLALPRVSGWASRGLAVAGERLGPRRAYDASLRALSRVSAALHNREVRDCATASPRCSSLPGC